jgi:hypothetical protein
MHLAIIQRAYSFVDTLLELGLVFHFAFGAMEK